MVALNQQFTVLATFCSIAAISMFSLSVNAVAIQGRSPSDYISSTVPFHDDKHGNSYEERGLKGKQRQGRTLSWSPINNAIRMADMAINSVRHSNLGANAKRDRHEAQAHFRSRGVNRREKSRQPIVVPNDKGGSYLVSPRRRSLHAGQSKATKRGEPKGTAGKVVLRSSTNNKSESEPLGNLKAQEDPESHTWFLNAAENEFTRMYLVESAPEASSFSILEEGSEVFVSLQISSLDLSQLDSSPLCATTNEKAQRMTAEECFGEKSNEQRSQTFAYNEKTGVLKPLAALADRKSDDPTTPTKAGVASVTNVIDRRDGTGEPATARNVTLVFVPNSDAASAEEDTPTATSTMTTTITVTNMSTATASVSAADVEPTSTAEASPLPNSALSSPATTSLNTESSMPVSTPVASAAALNVQVIGSNSTSSDDSTVASTTLTSDSTVPTKSMAAQDVESTSSAASVTVTSDSTTPTSSIKAADVAASIAASDVPSSAVPASTATNDTTSTPVPTVAVVESPSVSDTESPPAATVTPVSTEPYQKMFKADSRL